MRILFGIMAFVWLGLGIWGLIEGSDTALIVGLVNSTVNSVGGTVIATIKEKENK